MTDSDLTVTQIRRRFLAAAGTTAIATLSGCLGWLRDDEPEEPPDGWHAREFTTAEATETFSYREGTRTPYPGVEQIYAGGGTLVLVCFDYAHRPSIRWWREEFPKLSDLLAEGAFRPTLLMFPVPVNEWSILLPSAVFEVRARGTRADAWRFHELLVEAAPDYSFDLLRDLAAEVGVDGDAVVEAAEARRRRNQTFSDRAFGRDSGVDAKSLPAFRWGTDPIEGSTAADIREFVESRN
ncbi:DsbA family protein [Halobaculum sp. EA56]|uniref:DsbA family protein n=1 Tax=Halobaculum sp. EA56 TaxID=3421648 RepID=UPI003EBE577F